jgi:alpha-L-fucosidase 2
MNSFIREYVCSYPDKICSHTTSSSKYIPETSYSIKTTQGHSNFQQSCQDNSTLILRGQAGSNNTGMLYEVIGMIKGTSGHDARIDCANGVITVTNATDIWFIWTGGTEYDINTGNAAAGYTFKGPDPHASNLATLSSIGSSSYTSFVARHVKDYVHGTSQSFQLNLGQQVDWTRSTDELLAAYQNGKASGNIGGHASLLEWILFNYGRHLIFSSARGNVPANLQGVWSHGEGAPWSGGECQFLGGLRLILNPGPSRLSW